MKFEGFGFSAEIDENDYNALQKVSDSNFIGLVGGDWLKYWRWNNLVNIAKKFRKKCEENQFNPQQVAPKFLSHFFENCSLEDDESLQDIWADLLYSESNKQGSVSLKTLQVLKFMSKEEAKILKSLFQYVIRMDNYIGFIFDHRKFRDDFGIQFGDLLELEEQGLIQRDLSINTEIGNEAVTYFSGDFALFITNITGNDFCPFRVPIYKLTKTGFEIFKLEKQKSNLESIKYFAHQIQQDNKGIKCSLHEIIEFSPDGKFTYLSENLLIEGDRIVHE